MMRKIVMAAVLCLSLTGVAYAGPTFEQVVSGAVVYNGDSYGIPVTKYGFVKQFNNRDFYVLGQTTFRNEVEPLYELKALLLLYKTLNGSAVVDVELHYIDCVSYSSTLLRTGKADLREVIDVPDAPRAGPLMKFARLADYSAVDVNATPVSMHRLHPVATAAREACHGPD